MADVNFYFDPVCPFAWMTSKWVRKVQAQRDYTVEWRFISLRLLNAHVDYDAQFPPEYEAGHTAGLRLLRAAAVPTLAPRKHDGADQNDRDDSDHDPYDGVGVHADSFARGGGRG